jgi:phage terminase small subunit
LKNSQPNAAPKGLSPAARGWWKLLLADFAIEDPAGRLLLETALRNFDRAEAARRLLDEQGIVITDRWGQSKPHPAAAVERDARSGMLAAFRALNLDLEPLRDRPGRPGGR